MYLLLELCWNSSNSQYTYTFIRSGQKKDNGRTLAPALGIVVCFLLPLFIILSHYNLLRLAAFHHAQRFKRPVSYYRLFLLSLESIGPRVGFPSCVKSYMCHCSARPERPESDKRILQVRQIYSHVLILFLKAYKA